MKTKKNKTLWIVLGIIVIVIAALSISTCINSRVSVDYSEFNSFYHALVLEESKNNEGKFDAKLTKAEVAQIVEIVQTQTGLDIDNIKIIPVE